MKAALQLELLLNLISSLAEPRSFPLSLWLACGYLQNQAEQERHESLASMQLETGRLQEQIKELKTQNGRLHWELEQKAGDTATAAADAAGCYLHNRLLPNHPTLAVSSGLSDT